MSTDITLYDIASTFPGGAISFNTWITRYSLNFKGLSFNTEWVSYPDIEPVCKRIGASPTSYREDGSARYTLPVMHDHSTGAIVSDSFAIAKYLDKTYPDTPRLISTNLHGLYEAFLFAFQEAKITTIDKLIFPSILAHSDSPATTAFFMKMIETSMALESKTDKMIPKEESKQEGIKKFEEVWSKVAKWFGEDGNGRFVLGDTISLFDFKLAAALIWMKKAMGADSDEWKEVSRWNGGKWERLLADLKEYEGGVGV